MSIQNKIDVLKSQLTGDRGANDKILIEINGLMIEQHKQDTLRRIVLEQRFEDELGDINNL
tara:strand:+ start:499 stop:681 length:183 start_codon:yes stop_codon:yes gene_type:complete